MKSILRTATAMALALSVLGGTLTAQTISRLVPEAADAGDTVIIEGANLSTVTAVQFLANTGGFAGVRTFTVTPSLITPTRIEVQVPLVSGFVILPGVPGGGTPIGSIDLIYPRSPRAPVPFFFIEAVPTVDTLGEGTTQLSGVGRAVASFTLAGGPPVGGNAGFVLTCENATPNSIAMLGIGAPATAPYLPVGDGDLVIDISLGYSLLPGVLVGANGRYELPVPMAPGNLGITTAVQWLLIDSTTGAASLSKGLIATL